MIITSRFRAMGTNIELIVDAQNTPEVHAAMLAGHRTFADLEAKLSRFRPDSELSRLNREREIAAPSGALRAAVELALEAREATSGRFDPGVHDAVVAAGYDRSFDELPATVRGGPARTSAHGAPASIDQRTGTIRLADGARIDLGGIAKGLTAEIVAETLADVGPCLVNAGGDIATRGVPAGGAWPVGLRLAQGDAVVGLAHGALATSGRDRRAWTTTSGDAHHVIDPATGAPAATDVLRITVFAPTAVDAETYATALMIVGADAAIDEARSLGLEAIVVSEQGTTLMTEGVS